MLPSAVHMQPGFSESLGTIHCTHADSCSFAGNVVLNSSVAASRRRFACEGELVIFTCEVVGSNSLEWNSPLISPITYVTRSTAPTSTSRPPFFATLSSIAGDGLNTNFTSTLQVNASRTFQQADTTVECNNQQQESKEANFTVAGG